MRLWSPVPSSAALLLAAPLVCAGLPSCHAAEGKARIAVAAFGLYGDQSVFDSEARRAARIVADRFGSSSVTVLSNTASREEANAATLAATLKSVSKDMDSDHDVLFVILTSHGSQAGLDVKAGSHEDTLSPLNLIKALDDTPARYRVIVISACYSGVFVRPLADPNTLVITAADTDHSSFGCRNGNVWTYFGDAFFNTAMRHKSDLREAFAEASAVVRKREQQKHLTPSNPQMSGGENVEHVLRNEFEKVVSHDSDGHDVDPRYAFAFGMASATKGDYKRAITAYSAAIGFDAKYPIAYNNRGVAYFRTGDNDHAIADYSEAIRLNPKVASAWSNRGRAFREKGDNDRAIADYSKAISLDAKFAAAYNNRGLAFAAKGNNDRAIADYTRAIALDPKLANAFENRGRALRAKGDVEHAHRDFEQAIKFDPSLADTLKVDGTRSDDGNRSGSDGTGSQGKDSEGKDSGGKGTDAIRTAPIRTEIRIDAGAIRQPHAAQP
jgi:tetratricopeptide (TPR) repeat protein